MKIKGFVFAAIFTLAIISIPNFASATLISIGDPFNSNSWNQQFNESGVGNFNFMEAFMISADGDFEADGFVSFSSSEWTGKLVSNDYITALSVTAATSLNFYIKFAGDQSNPLTFDFLAWYDGTFLEAARASWNGGGWAIVGITYNPANYTRSVPEPTTLLLIGAGLIGLAVARRKFKK